MALTLKRKKKVAVQATPKKVDPKKVAATPVVGAPVVSADQAHRDMQRATRSQTGSRSRRLGGKLVA